MYIDLVISLSTEVLGLKAVALAVAKVRKLAVTSWIPSQESNSQKVIVHMHKN